MENIIDQLSEIEKTANSIVTEASNQKEAIFKEAEDKKKMFDEEIAQDVEKRISNLRQSLYAKKDQDMNDLKVSTKRALDSIQEIYDHQHGELAQQIVNRIVGV